MEARPPAENRHGGANSAASVEPCGVSWTAINRWGIATSFMALYRVPCYLSPLLRTLSGYLETAPDDEAARR